MTAIALLDFFVILRSVTRVTLKGEVLPYFVLKSKSGIMKKHIGSGLLVLGILSACNNSAPVEETEAIQVVETELDGELLMKNNCLTCHGNGDSHETILAPPMRGVKMHYLEKDMSEDAFVTAVVNWVTDPKEKNTKMPGAVNRFKVMPKQNFDPEEVKAIARYMYNNDMPRPDWFDKHVEEEDAK